MDYINVDLSEEHVDMVVRALEVYRDHLCQEDLEIKGDLQEHKDLIIDDIIVALGRELPW